VAAGKSPRASHGPEISKGNHIMANRPCLLDIPTIAAAGDGVLNDGGELPGCALEIHVRNGGKSKRAYFRYNGTPFGEKRTERLPLGSYELGLFDLRRERVACEQLIEQGKSPKRYRTDQQEKRRAATMTLRDALEEYWKVCKKTWAPSSQEENDGLKRRHLDKLDIMDMPLDAIRAHHLAQAIGDKWSSTTSTGRHLRSLLHCVFQFQIDKDDGVYFRPNPACWRKTSSLSRKLGPSPPSMPRACLHYEDLPKLVPYLCAPQDHWIPGYLTTMQAAAAYGRDPESIRKAHRDAGLFKGVIKAPPIWKSVSNLIPIDELKRVYGEFRYEPEPHEYEATRLFSRLARFVIFTPVRVGMALSLRWRNINKEKGIIEYLPRRKDPVTGRELPSEHKLGWKFPVNYDVILTDNLHALIEAQREQQIRDDVEIEPDGLVFMHGKVPIGSNQLFLKRCNDHGIAGHLTKAVNRLNAKGANIRRIPEHAPRVSAHGMRTCFTTWASAHDYPDNLINLSLGHIIPAIRQNKSNWSYYHQVVRGLIPQRQEMMAHWERHCLSLCGESQSNVVQLHPKSA
jgi:integrase